MKITKPILFPTRMVHLAADVTTSWIQVAKTGEFFSRRYGQFSITQDDLAQMLHNFKTVTPVDPTRLPVDYDHLSMDPKAPGDGKAAGWFSGEMELRDGGDTLWATVEWTEEGAAAVRSKEYQFVSPSFIQNYVWKEGEDIGTTLVAAAITNHPFLEGMEALTLSAGLEEMDVAVPISLAMNTGQRVQIAPEFLPEGAPEGIVFEIVDTAGQGDDSFARLAMDDGTLAGWYKISELQPAPAEEGPDAGRATGDALVVASDGATGRGKKTGTKEKKTMLKLKNWKGEEVEVDEKDAATFMAEQLQLSTAHATETAAAVAETAVTAAEAAKAEGIAEGKELGVTEGKTKGAADAVPAGSVVVNAADFKAQGDAVKTLSTQVASLADSAAVSMKSAHTTHVEATLADLSRAGRISKPQREWALSAFGEDVKQRSAFDGWVKTVPTKGLVNLGEPKGSDNDGEGAGATEEDQLNDAAILYAKEHTGMTFGDAVVAVSNLHVNLSEDFHRVDSGAERDEGRERRYGA